MSNTFEAGKNYFRDLPLADPDALRWPNGLESYDPMLRGMAAVGLSAILASASEATTLSDNSCEIIESGDILDQEGTISPKLEEEVLFNPDKTAYDLIAIAGLSLVSVSFHTSKLFNGRYAVRNQSGSEALRKAMGGPVESKSGYNPLHLAAKICKTSPEDYVGKTKVILAKYGKDFNSAHLETEILPGSNTANARMKMHYKVGDTIRPLDAFFSYPTAAFNLNLIK